MAWFAVDKDGTECVFESKPIRERNQWIVREEDFNWVVLPSGSIEKLIGIKLEWDEEPVEVK